MRTFKAFLAMLAVILLWLPAVAGTIDPYLAQKLEGSAKDAYHKVILMMAEQADIYALDQQLTAAKATLAERNRQVVTSLRTIATRTQGPVLAALADLESTGSVKNVINLWIANMIVFEGTADAIRQAASMNEVAMIYFDPPIELIEPVKAKPAPADRVITSHEIGLDRINAPAAWSLGFTGAGRVIANMDTGVDGNHPALASRFRGDVNGNGNYEESWFDPYDTHYPFPTDTHGHGTHTMGTICGRTPSGDTIGVAIDAQWIAAAPIDRGGGIGRTISDAVLSFQWIADPDGNPNTQDNPDAVGNSWGIPDGAGYPNCDQTFWVVIDNCEAAGTAVIFSAGNESTSGLRSPADRATTYYNCFSVGAVDGNDPNLPIAYFSALGPTECATGDLAIKPEVVAPGVDVRSSLPNNSYGYYSGTSMASPHVTGSCAVIRQANPNIDVNSMKNLLMLTATDLGPTGEENTYGHGIINLYLAVLMAAEGGYVEGYIRDAITSLPLPGRVRLVGGLVQTTAGADGHYLMFLPGDTTVTLEASYFGYLPLQYQVAVISDDTVTRDFALNLAPTAVLEGTVSAVGGGNIPNAVVQILDTPIAPETTDANGFYIFPTVPSGSAYRVQVNALGYGRGLDSIFVQYGQTNVLNFSLWPAQDFEITNGGYTGDGAWEWGTPTYGPSGAWSGAKCWGTVLGGTYPDYADDTLKSPPIMVTSPSARLEFYHWYAMESSYDGGNVGVSTDNGATWSVITPDGDYPDRDIGGFGYLEPGYTGNSGGWRSASFDLSSFYNQTIIIRWRFGTDGSVYDAGWYIDDVVLIGTTPPPPPHLSWSPSSFTVDAPPGVIEVRNLTLTNSGDGPLFFNLSTTTNNLLRIPVGQSSPQLNSQSQGEPLGYMAADKSKPGSIEEPYYPPVINNTGGPDAYGHTWIDSDEPNGPVFSWIDITGPGTPVNLYDDSYAGPFSIGFPFEFYGTSYNELYIGSNGILTFGSGSSSLGNTGLPDTSTPNNLIAVWWDDMNPDTGGSVYYYFDASNNYFVVSYIGVPRYSSYGSHTFQAILYPNGKIKLQYGVMDPGGYYEELRSATIGIENSSGTDGLQVVYNADYMHDSLAIEIDRGWLFVSPASGVVPPHSNLIAPVTFDGTSLNIGTYTGTVHLSSNDSLNPLVNIPVVFNVGSGGTPNIVITPTSFADSLASDSTVSKSLKTKNTGTGTLAVTYSTASPWIQFSGGARYISPGDSVLIDITLNSAGLNPGTYNGAIHFTSNDPDTPSGDLNVTLKVFEPNISVSPLSIVDTLAPGSSDVKHLLISNSARGNLDYTITYTMFGRRRISGGASFASRTAEASSTTIRHINPEPLRSKSDPETYYPPVINNSGGPDAFGYRWVDSNEPNGPVYNWVDISSIGVPIGPLYDDDNQGPFPIGFNFNFYGGVYSTFQFCSNGWISFTSTSTAYYNYGLPDPYAPFDLVAPFWDDLYFPGGGNAYYYTNNIDSLVVSWENVPHYYIGGPYTFQLILLGSGKMVFQYQMLNDPDSSATVGIQNSDASIGLEVVYNAPYLVNNLAVEIRPAWLLVTPTAGRVDPFSSDTIDVVLDAGDLDNGTYTGQIDIFSNDPDAPTITIPVTLVVGGGGGGECDYVQGDINGDGQLLGGDVTFGVRYFKGFGLPPPDSCYMDSISGYLYVAGDVNGNCEFRGSDITRLVGYFKGTAELSYCHFFPPPPLRQNREAEIKPIEK